MYVILHEKYIFLFKYNTIHPHHKQYDHQKLSMVTKIEYMVIKNHLRTEIAKVLLSVITSVTL